MRERRKGYQPLAPEKSQELLRRWREYKEKRGGLAGQIYLDLGLNHENLTPEEANSIVSEFQNTDKGGNNNA